MSIDQSNKSESRFLDAKECETLVGRIRKLTSDGKATVSVGPSWTGNIRWGKNEIISCGDVRDNAISITRTVNGASAGVMTTNMSDTALKWAITRADRLLQNDWENPEVELYPAYIEPYKVPEIWFDSSATVTPEQRSTIATKMIEDASAAGMVSAGYVQTSGNGRAINLEGVNPIYHRFSMAQLSMTVRDPKGLGSGWAGIDWNDWNRVDQKKIMETALQKCLNSRNPVSIEPGRYTVILEPQAVHDFTGNLFSQRFLDRMYAEDERQPSPYSGVEPRTSKIGLRLFDERINITMDPMHPDCSFLPISFGGSVYNRAEWVKDGVLKNLAHSRGYAIQQLGLNSGLPSNSSYMMSGGTSTIEQMISNTDRGLLVTRFSGVNVIDARSMLSTGLTRDGLWLVERGKISKAVRNLRFTETPFHTLNNIAELGVPQRVFSPSAPVVVPAIRAVDFSFTSTVDAI